MRRRECPPKATPTASPSIPPAVGGRWWSSAGRDIGRESRLCVPRVRSGAIDFSCLADPGRAVFARQIAVGAIGTRHQVQAGSQQSAGPVKESRRHPCAEKWRWAKKERSGVCGASSERPTASGRGAGLGAFATDCRQADADSRTLAGDSWRKKSQKSLTRLGGGCALEIGGRFRWGLPMESTRGNWVEELRARRRSESARG